jgi:uncharacterized membrane protein YeaQ/YmgE (transglycosylase-associated protein family)
MFSILTWAVFGLIAGSVAEWIFPPKTKTGKWQTIVVGAAGSIVGGLATSIFSGGGYHPAGFVTSVIGAIACLWAWATFIEEGK